MDEMTLTLNNPLTEEEWDLIEDVDFDKTNSIEFHTKHGKTVKFVKSTDERTGDLISRQAAVDAVKSYWKAEVDAIPKDADFFIVTATCDMILKLNEELCRVLDQLPSAQPEPCEDAVSRHRLLSDLEELIVAWEKYPVMAEQRKAWRRQSDM